MNFTLYVSQYDHVLVTLLAGTCVKMISIGVLFRNTMYSFNQVRKGIHNPALVIKEIQKQVHKRIPHEVGIQGSYNTGNIGDRALGNIFEQKLESEGYRAGIFDHSVTDSNTDRRILGGGGVLHDWYGTEHLKRRLQYVSGGDKGYILGVGAPGFKSKKSKQLINNVLPQMDVITVRDERSRQNIKEVCDVNVTVTACPAFLYNCPEKESDSQRTGVNFRPYFDDKENITDGDLKYYFNYEDTKGATEKYIENARYICETVENPVFIPFHKKDEKFAREYLDIPVLDYKFSVEETLKRVSSVNKMVTTRYHSLIFAAVCDKPVFCIAYEPKVEQVAERLNLSWRKPHREIDELDFEMVDNMHQIRNCAQTNFDLLFRSIDD